VPPGHGSGSRNGHDSPARLAAAIRVGR
jgi:hypothetical protein